MKSLLPALVLMVAASASCMLDLKGMPSGTAGAGGRVATTSSAGLGGGATASASGSGGAGGEAATVTSSASSSGTGGSPTGWTRRRKLTLDSGVDIALDGFSILVHLEKDVFNYGQTLTHGEDLRFTDDQGALLDHEIERWNDKGDSIIWVRIPSLKKNDSPLPTIWMYYGNSKASDGQKINGVWSAGYRGVWHLGEDGDQFADSSGKTSKKADNKDATQSVGFVGKGRSFDAGKHQFIDTNNTTNLKKFTVEVLVRGKHAPSANGGPNGPLMHDNNYQLMWDHQDADSGSASFKPMWQGWNASNMKPLNANTWYYLAATYDGTTLRTYKDGAHQNSDVAANEPEDTIFAVTIGRHGSANADSNFFDGDIDEVRIADTSRPDKWFVAQNRSMRDNLVSYGPEETAGGPWALP
jgi:Concanavalin A-like lectin/glucanases superfamily/Domain of unknown function (DUF2341)